MGEKKYHNFSTFFAFTPNTATNANGHDILLLLLWENFFFCNISKTEKHIFVSLHDVVHHRITFIFNACFLSISLTFSAGHPVINQRRREETSSMFSLKSCVWCCRAKVTPARWTNPPSCREPLTSCRNKKVRERSHIKLNQMEE